MHKSLWLVKPCLKSALVDRKKRLILLKMKTDKHTLFGVFKQNAALPEQVFQEGWGDFLVFDSDRVFHPSFAKCFAEFSLIGNSTYGTLVNLDQLRNAGDWNDASRLLESNLGEEKYSEILKSGGPGNGWIYRMDCFSLIPDNLIWALYIERASEIGIVAFPISSRSQVLYDIFSQRLYARQIKRAFDEQMTYVFTGQGFTNEWRVELIKNYS